MRRLPLFFLILLFPAVLPFAGAQEAGAGDPEEERTGASEEEEKNVGEDADGTERNGESGVAGDGAAGEDADADAAGGPGVKDKSDVLVYVIPITEGINKANLYVLRRGLKEAIAKEADMVLLDMDTPGGRVDVTLEMMEMLARFEGITGTYVNPDAISAGSFIAAATREIYFAPTGKMGASAVIQGGGQEVPETARQKIESYLRANIRALTEDYPYRADVIRAMLDADFVLEIEGEVIKPAGELLTLTASEAVREYGDPPQKLLGEGIFGSVEELMDDRFGAGNYTIRSFELTYSESLAKWLNAVAPGLMGLGMLLLFIEFKTPGFGIFGIAGLALIGIFFASQYIAGLAGNEPILFFILGVALVLVEILLFPGTIFFAATGLLLMFCSMVWAMVDYWPGEDFTFTTGALVQPLLSVLIAMFIALAGAVVVSRFFPGSRLERSLVLGTAVGGGRGDPDPHPGGGAAAARGRPEDRAALVGQTGTAVSDLFPSGRVEIGGKRYEARAALGMIRHGAPVRVVRPGDFALVVEEVAE